MYIIHVLYVYMYIYVYIVTFNRFHSGSGVMSIFWLLIHVFAKRQNANFKGKIMFTMEFQSLCKEVLFFL